MAVNNLIDVGAGVTNGAQMLGSYYDLWDLIYKNATMGTVVRIQVGSNYASLRIHPPSLPVPRAPNPPVTVNGTPWIQPILPTNNSAMVTAATWTTMIPGVSAWAAGNTPPINSWQVVVASPTIVCIISATRVCWSADNGVTWSAPIIIPGQGGIIRPNGAVYGAGKFLAICARGLSYGGGVYDSSIVHLSSDGVTWTTALMPYTAGGEWITVTWNGTIFCALGDNNAPGLGAYCVATSTDGITWESHTMPAEFYWYTWYAITWNGTMFCAVATGSNVAATSPDGITWTQRTLPSSATWNSLAWNGTNFCTVAANSTKAAVSDDGITWQAKVLPANRNWYAMTSNGAEFCAVAYNTNVVATSADGSVWAESPLPVVSSWVAITAQGASFYITSAYDKIAMLVPGTPVNPITPGNIATMNAQLQVLFGANAPIFYLAGSPDDPDREAGGFNILAMCGVTELLAPPATHTAVAAFDMLTAPPLPFESDATVMERTSPIEVSIFSAAQVNHMGVPFEVKG
jgi:hypothetical protein